VKETTPNQDFFRGIWKENPVLIQMLGLCPTLAVTNTVENSLYMGVATFFVLCGSSLLISSAKTLIPHEVRISTYILVIATFVSVADMAIAAINPDVYKALGASIALIVVNCMILGRQEAFASKRPVSRALLDAVGTGFGFIIALFMMGAVREILGSGSFLGMSLFGPNFEPWVVFVLPPGGFLTLGFILLFLSWLERRRAQRAVDDETAAGDASARRVA